MYFVTCYKQCENAEGNHTVEGKSSKPQHTIFLVKNGPQW